VKRRLIALIVGAIVAALAMLPGTVFADDVRLSVPYRSQMDDSPYAAANCGPASLAMILAGYGKNLPTSQIRREVNELQGTEGNYDSGTFIEVLALLAKRHGLEPRGLFSDGENLRRWTFDDVRDHLDAGHPIIPQVWFRGLPDRRHRTYDGDHYIVLTGYDGDDFIYHDPIDVDASGSDRRMTTAQFDLAWRNSDFPYAALAVAGSVITPSLRVTPTPVPSPTSVPAATSTPLPTATIEAVLVAAATPDVLQAKASKDFRSLTSDVDSVAVEKPITAESAGPSSQSIPPQTSERASDMNTSGMMRTGLPIAASTCLVVVLGWYFDSRARRARERRWLGRTSRRPLRSL
jgi:hypothetical protein